MTGRKLGKESKEILIEICLGIGMYCILGELLICLFPINTVPVALAFFLGCAMSTCSMIHITYMTELVLDMHNQKEARKYTIGAYLLRMAVVTAVVLIVYFTAYLNMAALFIGLIGIKAGAYLQPFTHRFLEWSVKRQYIRREGGE